MFSVIDYLTSRNFFLILIVLFYLLYKWMTLKYDFFRQRNVPYDKPLPFFGSVGAMMLAQEPFFDTIKRLYMSYKEHQLFGFFEMRNPAYIVADLDLIKRITIQDFDHFSNHQLFFNPNIHKLFANSLFSLEDQKWRDMRPMLTPMLTASKMREMFPYVDECCRIAIDKLKTQLKTTKDLEVDMRDLFTRFTTDALAICVLGIQVNSQLDEDDDFYKMTKKGTHFTSFEYFKVSMLSNCSKIMEFFSDRSFDCKFSKLIWDTLAKRIKQDITRSDIINLLHHLREARTKDPGPEQWTDDELAAQCFLFFVAGFETTSVSMGFLAHELMENPDIQAKLIAEIDQCREELAGNPLTYDALTSMKYMDMVVTETLRKWPALVAVDRVCTKPYVLNDVGGKSVKFDVGDKLVIPIAGIHRDAAFYPNPEKFDPDRFSDENKKNIRPLSYLAFGTGPRKCIGYRFAFMKIKAIIFHILSEFTLEPSPQTCIPITLAKMEFQLGPKNKFKMYFRPRR